MKNIIITGASQGIGKELAKMYARDGNRIVAMARNAEALNELSAEIGNDSNFFVVQCDVASLSQCKAAADFAIEKLGTIDLAILNAGVSGSESFTDFNVEHIRKIYDINVFGVVNFLEILLPDMIKNKQGTIVGVSSLADSRGMPGSAAYCSSKAALSHLLEAARTELAKYNVKIITVRPGFVRTNLTAKNNFKMPFIIDVDQASKIIYDGIAEGKKRINFPLPTSIASTLGKIVPAGIFDLFATKIKVFDS